MYKRQSKQDALTLLTDAAATCVTDVETGATADQLDPLLDSLQLFSTGTVPREQFETDLKDCSQLYQQISGGNVSVSTDAMLVPLHSFNMYLWHLRENSYT